MDNSSGANFKKYFIRHYHHFIVFAASIFVLAPVIITQSWPRVHDGLRYVILTAHFNDAFSHGILYPRWLPDLNGGYGYPLFIFYQPLFFFLANIFSFLFGPVYSVLLTIIFLIIIGGLGVYKLCEEAFGRLAAVSCSIFFLITPYLYVDLYVRGALSELAAMLILSWPLFFLLRLKRSLRASNKYFSSSLAIAFILAAIILAHPLIAMFFLPVFMAVVLYLAADLGKKKKEFFLSVGLAVFAAVILSLPYWINVLLLRKYVFLEAVTEGFFSFNNHFVYINQLFSNTWGFGLSIPGNHDKISFQLGLVHFILATLGFVFANKHRLVRACYILYAFLIFLMTPLSRNFWKLTEIFKFIQFPWRLLSITALLQAICAGGFFAIYFNRKNNSVAKLIFIGVILSAILYNFQQFCFMPGEKLSVINLIAGYETKYAKGGRYTYASADEFLPKTALYNKKTPPLKNTPKIISNLTLDMKPLKNNTKFRIGYEILSPQAKLIINQLYFPGWRVLIDGKDIPDEQLKKNLTKDGRMIVDIDSGRHTLEAFYDGPPGWRLQVFITLFLTTFIAVFLFKRQKRFCNVKH